VRHKRFEYRAAVDREGRILADGGTGLEPGPEWTPEHLVLAGLMRCTLDSLRFYAERADVTVAGSAIAEGLVTKREEDGRYAFVEIECGLDVQLDPAPEGEGLTELLDRAEQGCFVCSSLTSNPRYQWRVNGEVVAR
jgi:organic hydroperoxide reductase OsmC/OhrA